MKLYLSSLSDVLVVREDKRDEVFSFGLDNIYPDTVENLINGSVTSKLCVDLSSKSIYGSSFGDAGNIIVNKEGHTLNQILRISAREFTKFGNVYVHIGYNADLKINSIKILPAVFMRVGKSDDLGYSGKLVQYENWDSASNRIYKKKFKVYDRYNPSENVIKAQIKEAGGILKYKGQVIHLKGDTNDVYGISDLNTVLYEALLEANSQRFRANNSENGFLSTKLMVVKPFSKEEERSSFKKTLKQLQGADNTGKVLLLESSQISDTLSEQIKLEDLSSPYNDKLFEYSDAQSEKNICKAFGIPTFLISNSESGLFGNSGELIIQSKQMVWESQSETRDMFNETFSRVLSNWKEPIKDTIEIQSPYNEIKETVNE